MNLWGQINSDANDYCPRVTGDGGYIFFTSSRYQELTRPLELRTYGEIVRYNRSPGNGNGDIYWVKAGIIESLIPDN